MPSSIDVVVSPLADRNIRQIPQYTFKTWGSDQEDTYRKVLEDAFRLIQRFPDIGHPAEGRPSNVREYHLRYHVIQYRREPDAVIILRIINPRRGRR